MHLSRPELAGRDGGEITGLTEPKAARVREGTVRLFSLCRFLEYAGKEVPVLSEDVGVRLHTHNQAAAAQQQQQIAAAVQRSSEPAATEENTIVQRTGVAICLIKQNG